MNSKLLRPFKSPEHIVWRWTLLIVALIVFLAARHNYNHNGSPLFYQGIRLLLMSAVDIFAAIMALKAARQFNRSETTYWAWIILSLMGLADFVVLTSRFLPAAIGMYPGATTVVFIGFVVITLSRMLLAWGLWMMIRVYRNSGLSLRLYLRDYAAMVILAALGILSVILNSSAVRSSFYVSALLPLVKWVQLIYLPCLPALVLSSVFGVMIWRYARQMGGGLVAKAWLSVFLYSLIWLIRHVVVGWLPHYTSGRNLVSLNAIAAYFGGVLADYMLFLAGIYQYKACTEDVPAEINNGEQKPEPESR